MIVVALLLLEGAVRLATPLLEARIPAFYYGKHMAAFLDFDEVMIWAGRPRANAWVENSAGERIEYRINANGWRGKEFTPLNRPGNALVLGDSFTFGLGVAEKKRYTDRLDERLRGTNVWAFAHMGYAPDQYGMLGLRWLTAFPWAFVAIQLSNNDVQDVAGHVWGYVGGSKLPREISPPPSHFYFSELSRAWNLLMTFAISAPPKEAQLREGLERLLHSLEVTLGTCRELKLPVLLIQATDWGEPAYGKEIAEAYRNGVAKLAADYGATLLEANKDFQATLLPAPDSHWDAATHGRVADALFERVKLLPAFQPKAEARPEAPPEKGSRKRKGR